MNKKEWLWLADYKPNNTKTMDLIIKENGESNITRMFIYNPNGEHICYKEEPLKKVIKALHEVIINK